jgi:hypothetical protein
MNTEADAVPLTPETIAVILTGNTVYARRTDGAEAPIHYGADGIAHMRHFEHGHISGPWSVTDDGYRVEWSKGVGIMEWHLTHQPGEIAYRTAAGELRAVVTRIIAGDAEALAA